MILAPGDDQICEQGRGFQLARRIEMPSQEVATRNALALQAIFWHRCRLSNLLIAEQCRQALQFRETSLAAQAWESQGERHAAEGWRPPEEGFQWRRTQRFSGERNHGRKKNPRPKK